jgi:mono/diheme cytochrome c family protein
MRAFPILLGLAGVVAVVALRAPATANTASPDGAAIYKRCAACHLPTGAGVPGAFPPLGSNVKALAQSPAGRNYMALTVIKGVTGPVTVDGKTYRGVMPAQAGLDDAAVAALLNHVVAKVAKGSGKAFTAAEIGAARKTGAALNASAVGKLRPVLAGK